MSRCITLVAALLTLTACAPDGSVSGTETNSTAVTTGAGTTDDSSTAPTTGASANMDADSITGGPVGCVQSDGPIPLEAFAQTFAETICAQKDSCGCEVDFGCVGVFTQSFQAIADFAAANAMNYDAECAGHTLAATVKSRGCALLSEFYAVFDNECWNSCTIFRGDTSTGEACDAKAEYSFLPFVRVCADPAIPCVGATNTCQEPPATMVLQEGDDCFSPMDGPLGACAEPTLCSFATGKCVQPANAGESCAGGVPCAPALWCDAQSVCQPEQPAGAGCSNWTQCASAFCPSDVCEDPAAICITEEANDLFFSPALPV